PPTATQHQNAHDEDRTGHDTRRLGRAREGVAKLEHDDRAEKTAPERSDAAENGDQDGLPRRGPVQQVERSEAVPEREETAGQAGEAAGAHEGEHSVAPGGGAAG